MAVVGRAATTFENGNLKYTVDTEASGTTYGTVTCSGLSTAGSSGTSLELTIPGIVSDGTSNYYVTKIGSRAFSSVTNIISVRIVYGVTNIGIYAFRNCTNLAELRLPSSITVMGAACFNGCSRLLTVYSAAITPAFTSSNSSCFDTSTTRRLLIPWGADESTYRSVAAFSTSAFPTITLSSAAWDFRLTSGANVVISKASSSTSEDHEATIIGFQPMSTNPTSAQGILSLTASRTKLSALDRYFTYKAVAPSAFNGNTELTGLTLTNATGIEQLGEACAANCPNLVSANIPSGVVGKDAFARDSALTSLTLGSRVTRLESMCFYACTSLTGMTIPASVTYVSPYFIDGCTKLNVIRVSSDNENYAAYFYSLYNKDLTTLVRVAEGIHPNDFNSVISPGMTTIGENALNSCNDVFDKTIEVPYGVKHIGEYAFANLEKVEKVFLPGTIESIGDYAFSGCGRFSDVNINTTRAIPINVDKVFKGTKYNWGFLEVRRYMVDAFKKAGWTGFYAYNYEDDYINYHIPYDIEVNNHKYTVTSTEPFTLKGVTYDGRVKFVKCHNYFSPIPADIEHWGKTYAVTCIDTLSITGISSGNYQITGCANVDSVCYRAFDDTKYTNLTKVELPYASYIGNEAFYGCEKLTNVTLGSRLKSVGRLAFADAPIKNDLILPVGLELIGYRAFKGAQSKRMLIPSTARNDGSFAYGMSALDTLIVNADTFVDGSSFDLTDVPSTCRVFVPVGAQVRARAHSDWKRFGTQLTEGAFDFCEGGIDNMANALYTMTVTSTEPTRGNTDVYDGTAKYVYNSNIKEANSFTLSEYETDNMLKSGKKYLMTEIGDSCFIYSNVTSLNFKDMTSLKRIGRKTFFGSKLVSADLPESRISFGYQAFHFASDLKEVVTRHAISWDDTFFGMNASDFTLYVPNSRLYSTLNSGLMYYKFNNSEKCVEHIAPCFTATATTYPLAVQVDLDFESLDGKAYIVRDYDASTGVASTTRMYRAQAGQGVLLTDLTLGDFYKVPRCYSTVSSNVAHLVGTGPGTTISSANDAYYWDTENLKFVRPSSSYAVAAGQCYLEMTGAGSEIDLDIFTSTPDTGVKGDLNGDGIVDITDVNMAINMVLGKIDKTTAGDIDGSGDVDITDVNMVINLMLGK